MRIFKRKKKLTLVATPQRDMTPVESFHLGCFANGKYGPIDNEMAVDSMCAMGLAKHVTVYGDPDGELCKKLCEHGAYFMHRVR